MMYRKKPIVIEAFKLGADPMPDWFMDAITENRVVLHGTSHGFYHAYDTNADINGPDGFVQHADFGDYIIQDETGLIYACKPDAFRMTYEAVKRADAP